VVLASKLALPPTVQAGTVVSGTKHFVVLRTYFHDYANTSRYSQTQIQDFFSKIATLWGTDSSYGNITLTYEVSSLYQLPSNRSTYIDTPPDSGGDLSSGGKYMQVLNDAVANSPAGIDWSNVDGVVVVMAETNTANFHRGQGNKCNLNMGPGSSTVKLVGCAIFSENPSQTDPEVWGRFAHEIGHALQAGGPPHPSNYNSNFEQMDASYPGQTGVFEKQSSTAFGWLDDSKYAIVTPAMGGARIGLYAEEYNPKNRPNAQAIKAYIGSVGGAYYLISVRRRLLGDDLNDAFSPTGIPDEGVLIERVTENASQWVTLQGRGGDRNQLWHGDQDYTNAADNITIGVENIVNEDGSTDPDDYLIDIFYGDNSNRPDIGMNSWLQPPGNTYETTDIWVDSPVNGYGTYRFGTWSDLLGGTVPVGNGDDPAIGQVNRLYARVRNFGTATATNVVVHFDVTSPLGLGINGSNGFIELGQVTSADFPALASLAPGATTDVYINWTPNATLTPQQIAQGIFRFHSCVRVRMDHLANEIIFGNQDGNGQQENIDYFEAPAAGAPSPGAPYKNFITIHNDDKLNPKSFMLSYDRAQIPPGWNVSVNGGQMGVDLAADETRQLPIVISPQLDLPLGSVASLDVQASSLRLLTNDLDPNDKHPDFQSLGGVHVESRAMAHTSISCDATKSGKTVVFTGKLTVDAPGTLNTRIPVYFAGVGPAGVNPGRYAGYAQVSSDGTFTGVVPRTSFSHGSCLFAGTDVLSSASSGPVTVH
jgi:hypothetical protein